MTAPGTANFKLDGTSSEAGFCLSVPVSSSVPSFLSLLEGKVLRLQKGNAAAS
jgi:hypothetical protein